MVERDCGDVSFRHAGVAAVEGLDALWTQTSGDPRICIAVLDGPVDPSHPSLAGARLTSVRSLVPAISDRGPAARHGTHVASVIFGRQTGGAAVRGIAPDCRGLVVPIFQDGGSGTMLPCSQIDLARALLQSVGHGAHVINVSGGEFSPSGKAHPLLADAVAYCTKRNVLIVAAAGNDGCDCLHLPGAMPPVLAVGAMDAQGRPLESSNWGETYRAQGILAVGENIAGAVPGGGVTAASGTSFATPVVSGIAALLLSLQRKQGRRPDPLGVRAALLKSARGCEHEPVADCRRLLAGRLNVESAMKLIQRGDTTMSEISADQAGAQPAAVDPMQGQLTQEANMAVAEAAVATSSTALPADLEHPRGHADAATLQAPPRAKSQPSTALQGAVTASECASCAAARSTELVYAIGQLGYDFGTEARRDSFIQAMGGEANPHDPRQLLAYLAANPWDSAAVIWTLQHDAVAIYGIQVGGPFAQQQGERLRQFLQEQLTEGVERVSVPGRIVATARLINGQRVPVIQPELRGMYSWTTSALVKAVAGNAPAGNAPRRARDEYATKTAGIANFLERVYHEHRNLGITPEERAINFAATNAFNIERVYESAKQEDMELDTIEVERSPVCRPDSDCWDVKLLFFFPQRQVQTVRRAYRFSVDVSDVVPVTVGKVRSWYVR